MIYQNGGVYLDAKSGIEFGYSLDDVVRNEDDLMLLHWGDQVSKSWCLFKICLKTKILPNPVEVMKPDGG